MTKIFKIAAPEPTKADELFLIPWNFRIQETNLDLEMAKCALPLWHAQRGHFAPSLENLNRVVTFGEDFELRIETWFFYQKAFKPFEGLFRDTERTEGVDNGHLFLKEEKAVTIDGRKIQYTADTRYRYVEQMTKMKTTVAWIASVE